MLDLATIMRCHAVVPVRYWPVLWYWLGRLRDTYTVYAEEGREWFCWHLTREGVIWVSSCDESDEERRVRGALHRDFDRTPWTRLAPRDFSAFADTCLDVSHCTVTVPLLHSECTASAPMVYPALDPP